MTWGEVFKRWTTRVINRTISCFGWLDGNGNGNGICTIADGAPAAPKPYVILEEEVARLGEYGQLLLDLNKKRRQIGASLPLFADTALDVGEIQINMDMLFDDAKREAIKLAVVSQQLNMVERPDVIIKGQIKDIDQKLQHVKDPTIRDNLVETANSKTKQLIELGKIAVYKARVETKVTRLEAFLGELQLGVMRAGLEESPEYKEEIAQSVKSIRSSFETVDAYKSEVRLLEESADKKSEEVPYYIRYKEMWDDNGAAQSDPPRPAPEMKANGRAGESQPMGVDLLTQMYSRSGTPLRPQETQGSPNEGLCGEDETTNSEIRVSCPMCNAVIQFDSEKVEANSVLTILCECKNLLRLDWKDHRVKVDPLVCPHCQMPGPFSEVTISYSDKARRFRCGSCSKYFKDTDNLQEQPVGDRLYTLNKTLSSHIRRMEEIVDKNAKESSKHIILQKAAAVKTLRRPPRSF